MSTHSTPSDLKAEQDLADKILVGNVPTHILHMAEAVEAFRPKIEAKSQGNVFQFGLQRLGKKIAFGPDDSWPRSQQELMERLQRSKLTEGGPLFTHVWDNFSQGLPLRKSDVENNGGAGTK